MGLAVFQSDQQLIQVRFFGRPRFHPRDHLLELQRSFTVLCHLASSRLRLGDFVSGRIEELCFHGRGRGSLNIPQLEVQPEQAIAI